MIVDGRTYRYHISEFDISSSRPLIWISFAIEGLSISVYYIALLLGLRELVRFLEAEGLQFLHSYTATLGYRELCVLKGGHPSGILYCLMLSFMELVFLKVGWHFVYNIMPCWASRTRCFEAGHLFV